MEKENLFEIVYFISMICVYNAERGLPRYQFRDAFFLIKSWRPRFQFNRTVEGTEGQMDKDLVDSYEITDHHFRDRTACAFTSQALFSREQQIWNFQC